MGRDKGLGPGAQAGRVKQIAVTKVVGDTSFTIYPGPRQYEVLEEDDEFYYIRPFGGMSDRVKIPKEAARPTG